MYSVFILNILLNVITSKCNRTQKSSENINNKYHTDLLGIRAKQKISLYKFFRNLIAYNLQV